MVGNRLKEGAADVVAAIGAKENVPDVAGFAAGKPNEAPAVVVVAAPAAENNDEAPEENQSMNRMVAFLQIRAYQIQTQAQLLSW